MHTDEMWQLYHSNGEPIPGAGWESARDNPKGDDIEIVGAAVVFVFRKNSEGMLELLWQKRSSGVSRFPGFYDISAGGHINLGESLVDAAIREAREEIGAEISALDLNFITMRGYGKNRLVWLYAVDWTGREEEFHFSDEEVEEVKWVPFDLTTDFRKKYAKPSLKEDKIAFEALKIWFETHGYLENDGAAPKNCAFIDGQNLRYNTTRADEPWKIDLASFRIYLKEKYNITHAYYFIGAYNSKYQKLYDSLASYGYDVIFREHTNGFMSNKKGNVDTDIVFSAMEMVANDEWLEKIVLVSGDGDYFRMVDYLIHVDKFKKLLAPSRKTISSLYKRKTRDVYIDYLDKAEIKKKIILEEPTKNAGSP